MKFLGIEIEKLSTGEYFLHQRCYTQELLNRHGTVGQSSTLKLPEETEVTTGPVAEEVRLAQAITGELQWLASKTRPDIAVYVSKMASLTTRNPKWVVEAGRGALAYLAATREHGITYGPLCREDDSVARRVPRQTGTIEVMCDASFAVQDQHSVTGVMILYAGGAVHWDTRKQSLVALSTAEAELTALLDALQAGRSVRALVGLFEKETTMEVVNDNRAALILGSGQGGGWRTRHLRIRAACLAEAASGGEITLLHRPGAQLWADALTKVLPPALLERFKAGIGLRGATTPVIEEKDEGSAGGEVKVRMMKALMAMTIAASLPRGAAAVEDGSGGAEGGWSDAALLTLLGGILVIYELVKSVGWMGLRRLWTEEQLGVRRLDDQATLPYRATEGAAGYDIAASREITIEPGEITLVPTGLCLEIPRGRYGQLMSRSSLAKVGVEVTGGVIDSDYRGEVRVILANRGCQTFRCGPGDRVAQMILLPVGRVKVHEKQELESTMRGIGAFGSTNRGDERVDALPREDPAVRRLTVEAIVEDASSEVAESEAGRGSYEWKGWWNGDSLEGMDSLVGRTLRQLELSVGVVVPPAVLREVTTVPSTRDCNQWQHSEAGYPVVICYAHKKPR